MVVRRARSITLVSVGLTFSLLLAGCAPASEPETNASSVPSATEAPRATEAPAFPTTLVFEGGEVTLDSLPERVVTIGAHYTDAALALGALPVGIEIGFVPPWREEGITAAGGEAPVFLTPNSYGSANSDGGGLAGSTAADVEALTPDLILAGLMYCVYDCNPEETGAFYDSLDGVAPTVRPTSGAIAPEGYESATAWREALMQAGQALGQTNEAQAQLDSIDESLAAQAAAHPEFAGKTIAVVWVREGSIAYGKSNTAIAALLEQLGFTYAEDSGVVYNAESANGKEYYLWGETIAQLDPDVLIYLGDTVADPYWVTFVEDSVTGAEGTIHYPGSLDGAWGMFAPTALSVPWALDVFVDNVADALKG
ncbi:ABC transporter substrate-binding protein [Salinibacterium sp. SWN167]|uniref:ABC transporter substrate-binding protein n=1 Tax=Salinibacterium sp. SWN167 TaxID=2792054 RepID=UPI0018CCB1D8|nr:ABC transporter substrate-binding protein [Salinibacterium sp. SWN167]MBH0082374.1 ABC transporter substrate-binding protein [Salinibacterium sp. SWN167]